MSDTPVLICADDQVGAALLGALVETLGFRVTFAALPADSEAAIRRDRPRIALVDGNDGAHCSDSFLGRARMRGVRVAIYGSRETLAHIRSLAESHGLATLLMPTDAEALAPLLEEAYA